MINIKNQKEIDIMRDAGKRHAELMTSLRPYVIAGASTWDIEVKAREYCKELNLETIQIGYFKYPCATCIGINDDAEHCIPSKGKVISNGDIVTVDCAVRYNGFCSDGGYTIPVGTVNKEALRLINTTQLALNSAVKACIESNTINDISNAIFTIAKLSGYDVLKEFTGHGIGKEMHEDPYIFNFPINKPTPQIKSGMTFALDTMITQGKGKVIQLNDGWSTKTADGKLFSLFEYTVLVNKDTPEILNQF